MLIGSVMSMFCWESRPDSVSICTLSFFDQDFYSHSNWVELGNKAPYSALIRPDQQLDNLAGRLPS